MDKQLDATHGFLAETSTQLANTAMLSLFKDGIANNQLKPSLVADDSDFQGSFLISNFTFLAINND